ncbi:MAG TPA: PadR family transcriptional regulator [Streptosporangiaceae bacterium]|nr:PadR family transcriptional regulator [Streptosporangiaceae bacterium]
MTREELTPTSYALLGLLAIRPWTAYELAQQVTRNMRFFWPRSAAHVYSKLKRLERLGLTSSTAERSGNRPRTRYEITRPGRAALTAWMATPAAGPQLEIEGLLRLFLADQGTMPDLVNAIDATRTAMWASYSGGIGLVREYLDGEGPFPQRAHLLGLLAKFYSDFAETVLDWCDLADAEIGDWPQVVNVGLTDGARRHLEAAVSSYERRAEFRRASQAAAGGSA